MMFDPQHSTVPRSLTPTLATVEPTADTQLEAQLQQAIDNKTKPLGALGELELLACRLGLVQRRLQPRLLAPQLVVFAADHGLTAQGVSAYPQEVTWQMVQNMLSGGAASSVLARQMGLALTVVDAGVARPLPPHPGLRSYRLGPGTADTSVAPAMSVEQCLQALEQGAALLRTLPGNALLLGEMGIGNTSSAALLLARFASLPLAQCVGRGTGLDDSALARKQAVLARALARHQSAQTPVQILAALGGFEIAMMAGAIVQAAAERRVIVVDGFITGAAVMAARALQPAVVNYCVFSHQSAEQGHRLMLQALNARPLLDLSLRLGEGSGAALAWPLVEAAARLLTEMASFEAAGVAQRDA